MLGLADSQGAPLPPRCLLAQLCQVLDAAEFCRNAHANEEWRSAAQQVRRGVVGGRGRRLPGLPPCTLAPSRFERRRGEAQSGACTPPHAVPSLSSLRFA